MKLYIYEYNEVSKNIEVTEKEILFFKKSGKTYIFRINGGYIFSLDSFPKFNRSFNVFCTFKKLTSVNKQFIDMLIS